MANGQAKTISVPQRVFESMVDVYQKWAEFSDEFEDFALSSNQAFLQKMRRAQTEHKRDKTNPLVLIRFQ